MDFVSGLFLISLKKDSVWVMGDLFTKSVYFLAVCINYFLYSLVELYITEIVCFYSVLILIIVYSDLRFILSVWKSF